jgi:hypothetical protein
MAFRILFSVVALALLAGTGCHTTSRSTYQPTCGCPTPCPTPCPAPPPPPPPGGVIVPR